MTITVYDNANGADAAGTWLPALAGSTIEGNHTYANRGGVWVKNGPLVYVTGIVAVSDFDTSASGAMYITGLPFEGATGSHNASAFSMARFQGITFDTANDYSFPTLMMPGGVSHIQIVQFGSGTPDKSVTAADMSDTSAIRFTGTYLVGLPDAG